MAKWKRYRVELAPVEPRGPDAVGWTNEHYNAAMREGWFIADCEGSGNGRWQIQRFDDLGAWDWPIDVTYPFGDDLDVWGHIRRKAAEGSELHTLALAVIKELNPIEYKAITHS